VFTRDVDAAKVRAMAFLTPLCTERPDGGAAGFRLKSAAFSARVCLFDAGSGTATVSNLVRWSQGGRMFTAGWFMLDRGRWWYGAARVHVRVL
jgi:hypothetical protein